MPVKDAYNTRKNSSLFTTQPSTQHNCTH